MYVLLQLQKMLLFLPVSDVDEWSKVVDDKISDLETNRELFGN